MAEFGSNATNLSDPQGAGTQPVAPVQEQISHIGLSPVFAEVANIFAKGIVNNDKAAAEARKNAVVGEYVNNERKYGEALTSGQWDAGRVSSASRANYTKFIASHPEYMSELQQARSSVYGGTEVGEAQKRVDAETKQREADISGASGMGFMFYSGMSNEAQDKNIEAYKTATRLEIQTKKDIQAATEARAQRSDIRAGETHTMTVEDYQAKERAVAGVREIANVNFDSVVTTANDLAKRVETGAMTFDQAMAVHSGNINRIKAGLLSIAAKNPEMAAPWSKLFDDMDEVIKKKLDPNKKTEEERKLLDNQYNILITKSKLAAVANPEVLDAVVKTTLFQGDPSVSLAITPVVQKFVMGATGASTNPAFTSTQVVGTKDDATLFKASKDAITRLQTGKIPGDKLPQAQQEATGLINQLLKQTSTVDGGLDPKALKTASSFFASTEFGKMAVEGRFDKQTAANAQHVFQVQYEPAVRKAIVARLEQDVGDGTTLARSVDMQMVGNNVVFKSKQAAKPEISGVDSFIGAGMQGNRIKAEQEGIKDAEAGLNQLIRMHAHLEGTTDYAKYWEEHKHMLMPSFYPDPAKLKPGQVASGYKYLGGNYRDPTNWIAEPTKPAK